MQSGVCESELDYSANCTRLRSAKQQDSGSRPVAAEDPEDDVVVGEDGVGEDEHCSSGKTNRVRRDRILSRRSMIVSLYNSVFFPDDNVIFFI
jgi:hypothetical protein